MTAPSYHDLHVTTEDMERTSLFNLPFNFEVACTRSAGWQVWHQRADGARVVLAAEYGGEGQGLRLDVAGYVIVDTIPVEDAA